MISNLPIRTTLTPSLPAATPHRTRAGHASTGRGSERRRPRPIPPERQQPVVVHAPRCERVCHPAKGIGRTRRFGGPRPNTLRPNTLKRRAAFCVRPTRDLASTPGQRRSRAAGDPSFLLGRPSTGSGFGGFFPPPPYPRTPTPPAGGRPTERRAKRRPETRDWTRRAARRFDRSILTGIPV
ncbi:unnamed protein product, partial [Iphiclides podalirius]